jgi:probable HAF family extracellular repeat protein
MGGRLGILDYERSRGATALPRARSQKLRFRSILKWLSLLALQTLAVAVSMPAMAQGLMVIVSAEELARACDLNPANVQKVEITGSRPGAVPFPIDIVGRIYLTSGTAPFDARINLAGAVEDCWTSGVAPTRLGGATAVSPNGFVVGFLDNGGATPYHAFRYDIQKKDLEDLGTLNYDNNATTPSYALGVSSNGSVVVGYSGTGYGYDHAFHWSQVWGMVYIGAFDSSRAYDVSGDGKKIVGRRDSQAFLATPALSRFLVEDLTSGIATAITTDGSVVAGQSGNTAFRWTSTDGVQNLGALAGHSYSAALDISDNGIVVGVSSLYPIDFLGVGGAERYDQTNSRAFRWSAVTGLKDFRQLLVDAGVNMTGITIVAITGVSPDGQWIVGTAKTPDTGLYGTVPFIAQYCDDAGSGDCYRTFDNDLMVDFGTGGLWQRLNNTRWQKIHATSPLAVEHGDLDGGNGQSEVIASFSGSGLWARYNNTNWVKLHSAVPQRFVPGDLDGNGKDDLAVDFGASGLWVRYNNATWVKLHNLATQALAVGDFDGNGKADLLSDFGSSGLWVYNSTGWTRLHTLSPIYIATGDLDGNGKDEFIADFGGTSPIWIRYNNATWVKLHPWLSQGLATGDLDGNGKDEILIDFGTNGLWIRYNNATWTKLHSTSPVNIVTADLDSNGKDDAVIDFGGSLGLYVHYNNATWTRLSTLPTQAIVSGGFD